MNQVQRLNAEIQACILEIEMNHPELYYLLEETPSSTTDSKKGDVSEADLEDYLNSLKEQLKTFQKKQNKK